MNPVDAITSAQAALVIAPPATPEELDELDELAAELDVPLPEDLRAVLGLVQRLLRR
jgi:hypothetical protein